MKRPWIILLWVLGMPVLVSWAQFGAFERSQINATSNFWARDSITLGGVQRTTWPSGGAGSGGVQTNDDYSVLTGYPFISADEYSGTVSAVSGLLTLSGNGATVDLAQAMLDALYYPLTSNPSNWVSRLSGT